MKYMISMPSNQLDYDSLAGKPSPGYPAWKPEELQAMFEFMGALNAELEASGELVSAEGLDDPAHTRRVQLKPDGEIVVTDGPYAETTEVIAGYWIVDVDGVDRATEIAKKVTECPTPEGHETPFYIDIRPVGEGPEIPE
jgi:hypothetical protein